MKTIKNNTDHVITVCNGYFSKNIAINETISVSDQEIRNNYVLKFKFFSLKEKTENELEVVRTIGNRIGLWFKSISYIPLQTEFDIKDYNEIVLETHSTEIIFITKFFKKTCLLSPVTENVHGKITYYFPNSNCKKKFMLSLGVELLATIPLFVVMLYSCLISYFEFWGLFECISVSILTLFLAFCNTRKLYYLLSKFKNKRI